MWCRKFITVNFGVEITYSFNKHFLSLYYVLSPMLDGRTIMMNGTNMVPELTEFMSYQGRRVDRSNKNIIKQ